MTDPKRFAEALTRGDTAAVDLALWDISQTAAAKVLDRKSDISDAASETWIHLRTKVLPKLDPARRPFAYAYGSAIRHVRLWGRKEARATSRRVELLEADGVSGQATPDEIAAQREVTQEVDRRLRATGLRELGVAIAETTHGSGRPVLARAARRAQRGTAASDVAKDVQWMRSMLSRLAA